MAKQPYLTFREEENELLKYYILQKEFPHNCGIISVKPNPEALAQSAVAGYNIWIVHTGVLRGNFIAVYPAFGEELQLCYDRMAEWFHSERILKDEKRYDKFKVKQDATTT